MRIVTLDIGGTSIKSGLYENGILHRVMETETEAWKGGEAVLKKALSMISLYQDFNAIGISTAGQVNPVHGIITYANDNIPAYTGMPVKKIVETNFSVPVTVENDVNAAAIGEAYLGAGKGMKDFLMLTYGTGIGGAIYMNNNIYHGTAFSAAEFGRIIVHPEELKEGMAYSGYYETYASASALVRSMKKINSYYSDGRRIFENLHCEEVKSIVDQWIQEVVYGLVSLIYIFNPASVILGGGVMEQTYVEKRIAEQCMRYMEPAFKNVHITAAALGNQAGMYGAAILAEQLKEGEQEHERRLFK